MLKKILIVVAALIVIIPMVLFFGFKMSPIAWQLHEPINVNNTLAMQGYDPVAYFNDGEAVKGDTTKGLRWRDTIWYFSSEENKISFKAFPENYIPQYGGYCATAVAAGLTAAVNPEHWHIEKNKLYLFFDASAKNDFVAGIDAGIIEKADSEWVRHQ